MTFGERLKQLRLELNLRQEDISEIIKVHRATIGKYEANERFPDKDILVTLSKFFNVSTDYLLGLTDIREPIDELIKKGEISIKPPNDIERIYESLPDEEKKMFNDYAKYLEARAKLNQGDKESSATSEAI